MSLKFRFLLLGIVSAIAAIWCYSFLFCESEVPKIPKNQWWGRGKRPSDESKIPVDNPNVVRFKVNVSDGELQDLKQRLQNTRYSEPLEGFSFEYGVNAKYLKEVVDYWLNIYDWKKQEQHLNQFDHFTTQIEGINVHFLHVKPKITNKNVRVLPLMIIHGWPLTGFEFYKIFPYLVSSEEGIAFEIICPSIPGYGFSEAPHQEGFDTVAAARVFVKLMQRLGYEKFYIQGGDWGSSVTSALAVHFPQRVIGMHVNFIPIWSPIMIMKIFVGSWFPSLVLDAGENVNIFPVMRFIFFLLKEGGYYFIQAAKPDTVGTALSDSPAGLAACILEKFSVGTNPSYINLVDGGLTKKFTMDDLITNIMIFWITNSITSSMRFYKENVPHYLLNWHAINVPVGVAVFPYEVWTLPRSIAKHIFPNLVSYNFLPRGGHFVAFEEPELFADDIRAFITKNEALLKTKK